MKATGKKIPVLIIGSLIYCALLFPAEADVKVIQRAEDLPEKFSSLAEKGDLLIQDDRYFLLLGASPRLLVTSANYPTGNAMGSILGFVPAGQNASGDLNIGGPVLRIKEKTYYVIYSRLQPAGPAPGAEPGFEAVGVYEDQEGRRAEIKTSYLFHPQKGRVDIMSTITNTGKGPFEGLSYRLFFDAYHSYSFNPYDEKRLPRFNFRVYQKRGHSLGWVNFNPVEKEESRFPGSLQPGQECTLRYTLLVARSGPDLLDQIYQILETQPVRATVSFKDFEGDWMELIVREALSSAVFFRSILTKPVYQEIVLPPGVYLLRANFFPAVVEKLVEVRPDGENSFLLSNPPSGELKVRVQNSRGEAVPGKVTFIGLSPTESPYFRPENPVETGRSWEGFKNSCFPGQEGLVVRLPAGTYLASASRGPEYAVAQKVIEVVEEENRDLTLIIDRILETPRLISFDPHLHTLKSDGSPSVGERIKSVTAEGVEVMAATDHNYITDYSGDLKSLKLDGELAVMPGNEVTTAEVIHFNNYPLDVRPDEMGNGAINSFSDTASRLFLASRQKNPNAVLQVNHPRAGDLGYFNNYSLDQESAATALAGLDMGFDLLEVLNGPYFYSSNKDAVEDWFHLLNRGYYFAIVGSSDAHGIDRGEPGYSRTYVDYSGGQAARLDTRAFLQALKKGRSFVTNGPVVALKVNGQFGPGDLTKAAGGKVAISLEVRSAPWVAVDEVRLVFNGKRRIIFPVQEEEEAIQKFAQEISLTLTADTYICLEALGKRTLFPVLQRASRTGSLKDGTLPYALTNPVFVDVDGNGRFDPPLPEKIRATAKPGNSNKKISRY
ncbi:MAG: CehA/McbA family metallohydrolase [Acidobacteriota bacterium]